VTVTGRKSTARLSTDPPEGVLFLTAGYGTRADPLSVLRPKALLPWGEETLLGRLAAQASALGAGIFCANASRCPELVLNELSTAGPDGVETRLLFEERPLGAVSTICRLGRTGISGTWAVSNTDMVMETPFEPMLRFHRDNRAHWTIMTGNMPGTGDYGELHVDSDGAFGIPQGYGRHYLGISILEPEVFELAVTTLGQGSLFGELAPTARSKGLMLKSFEYCGEWKDMGRLESIRKNILDRGCFVHPFASVSSGAVLQGSYYIGKNCLVAESATVRDSVMLDSSVVAEGLLSDSVLPWYCRFPEVSHD
jgi:NDP-sugar pyrophosphorylase family protein